jgi:hypothetical protein
MEEHIVIGTLSITKNDEQIKFKFSPSTAFSQLRKKSKESLLFDFSLFFTELLKDSTFTKLRRKPRHDD